MKSDGDVKSSVDKPVEVDSPLAAIVQLHKALEIIILLCHSGLKAFVMNNYSIGHANCGIQSTEGSVGEVGGRGKCRQNRCLP